MERLLSSFAAIEDFEVLCQTFHVNKAHRKKTDLYSSWLSVILAHAFYEAPIWFHLSERIVIMKGL